MIRLILMGSLLLSSLPLLAEEFGGTLEWKKRVELGLVQSGVVSRVNVQPGQQVTKGEELVALEDGYLKARVARANAGLVEAKHDRDEGVRELERAMELYDRTVLSDHDLQMAKLGEARAQAAYRRAQAELAEARLALKQSTVVAPFSGVIVDLIAQPGLAVQNAQRVEPLVVLADDRHLQASANLTTDQLDGLQKGTAVDIELKGRSVKGIVEHLAFEPVTEEAGQSLYRVVFSLQRPDEWGVRIGLPVTIRTR